MDSKVPQPPPPTKPTVVLPELGDRPLHLGRNGPPTNQQRPAPPSPPPPKK